MWPKNNQSTITSTIILLVLAVFFAVSNRWFDWNSGLQYLLGQDVPDYHRIAMSGPLLQLDGTIMAYHKLQRFFSSWLVGTSAAITGTSVETTFYLFCLATSIMVLLVWHRIIRIFMLPVPAYLLCMGLLVLNNYFFRYHAIVPGMYHGIFFLFGLSVFFLGLIKRNHLLIGAGLVTGILGRQTMLLVIPVMWIWLLADPSTATDKKRTLFLTAMQTAIVFLIYHLLGSFAERHGSKPSIQVHVTGICDWYSTNIGTLGLYKITHILAEQVFRALLPVLIPMLAVLVLTIKNFKNIRPSALQHLLLWLTAAMIAAQPVLAGPEVTEQSGSRLGSFGLVPAIISLCMAIRDSGALKDARASSSWFYVPASFALGLYSLHHKYTVFGPSTVHGMLVCQLFAALIILVIFWRDKR